MSQILDLKNWYLSNFKSFEHSLNGESNHPIHALRKQAIERFSELNFPTTHDEDWKYTNISSLLKYNFKPSVGRYKLKREQITSLLFGDMKCSLLVFINGHYSEALSDVKNFSKGIIAGSIEAELKNNSEILYKHFGKYADYKEQIFTALSTAFTKDGAFVYVPDGKIVEDPIHILFVSSSENENILSQPRNLFIIGKNSQVSIIEHYAALNEDVYFTNSVTEIYTDENAVVDYMKLQEESKKAFHVSRIEVSQERNSNFTSHSISMGSEISRNDINAKFNNDGGESTLNGLYILAGDQLFDTHTLIDHAKPNCNSHEHYKGILTDKSRGVFNGKVIVRPDAQKTNAFQENNNIILSDGALVNTKPQLEIFADDVKCSHGATIGRLDEDALFYLKSRGIGEEKSKIILLHAFASDIVKTIKVEAVKKYLEAILENRFQHE